MKGFTSPNGIFVKNNDDGYDSFIPKKLPPEFNVVELVPLISEASNLIGTLNGFGKKLPNPHLLIRPQLMKEAVQSSRIEGSQVSLSELYRYQIGSNKEVSGVIDSEEVNNYVDALEISLKKVSEGADVDLDLINECHKILLRGVRGGETTRGLLRTKQNWIGLIGSEIKNAIYVPPTPEKVPELMTNLLDFMNDPPRQLIPLLQCAIVHYQFEAIHPYEDGNGRIGRLLVPLMLADRRLLSVPLLYLSGYIEQNKEKYYESLLRVSSKGEWVEWIRFFLLAVIHQATVSINLIEELDKLREQYLRKTNAKKISGTVIKIIDVLFEHPLITRRIIKDKLGVKNLSAKNGIDRLVQLGILEEMGVIKTSKVYIAREIYQLIE